MSETFKNRVDALTGFGSTEDLALTDWLTEGAEIIQGILPPKLKQKCIALTVIDGSPDSLDNFDTIGEIL